MHAWMVGALGALLAGSCLAIEEPRFELLSKDGGYELRRYAAFIVAETMVEGDMDAASNQGFRLIADFIFGNNQTAGGAKAPDKIAMTAPVTVEPAAKSEKISMTAPVTVEAEGNATERMANARRWRVHFVMPSQYTLSTLPRPNNSAVSIREVPARTFAVLVYSGFNTESRVQQRVDELTAWTQARNLQPLGAAQLARYDPPWTLPMWRRNEVMVEVRQP